MDQLCLDMAAKKLATDSVSLYIGYSYTYGVPGVGGTAQLSSETNAAAVILPAIGALYRRMVNPSYGIRRVCLVLSALTVPANQDGTNKICTTLSKHGALYP